MPQADNTIQYTTTQSDIEQAQAFSFHETKDENKKL